MSSRAQASARRGLLLEKLPCRSAQTLVTNTQINLTRRHRNPHGGSNCGASCLQRHLSGKGIPNRWTARAPILCRCSGASSDSRSQLRARLLAARPQLSTLDTHSALCHATDSAPVLMAVGRGGGITTGTKTSCVPAVCLYSGRVPIQDSIRKVECLSWARKHQNFRECLETRQTENFKTSISWVLISGTCLLLNRRAAKDA